MINGNGKNIESYGYGAICFKEFYDDESGQILQRQNLWQVYHFSWCLVTQKEGHIWVFFFSNLIFLPYYPAYKPPVPISTCAYIQVISKCAYVPTIFLQSVTKSLRSEIIVIPLILSQITVAQATFFIRLRFFSATRVCNTEYRAKFT